MGGGKRQAIWDGGGSAEETLAVDNHNNDLAIINHLEVEETQLRQYRLLSNEPEDENWPGFTPEVEQQLTRRM